MKTGLTNALGIYLSLPEKQEIMDILKRTMQDGHLHIPRDPELMNEMSNERYQLSKTGQLQFSHPSGTHDDRLWALALAVYAARLEVPKWKHFAFTTRNPNHIGPRFNWRQFTACATYSNTPWSSGQPGSWYIRGGSVSPVR